MRVTASQITDRSTVFFNSLLRITTNTQIHIKITHHIPFGVSGGYSSQRARITTSSYIKARRCKVCRKCFFDKSLDIPGLLNLAKPIYCRRWPWPFYGRKVNWRNSYFSILIMNCNLCVKVSNVTMIPNMPKFTTGIKQKTSTVLYVGMD